VYERELMAIVFAIQKWWHYLLGQRFTVFTDQKSIKFLLEQQVIDEGQQKWLSKLMGYNFDIKYKAGLENKVADALSRKFQFSTSFFVVAGWDGIEIEILEDAKLKHIMQKLLMAKEEVVGFTLTNGRLMYEERLVLTRSSKWIPKILAEFHSSKLGEHSGFFRTYKRISSLLYWEGMKFLIPNFINLAKCANKISHLLLNQLNFFTLYLFPPMFGQIYRWTL